MKFRKPRKKPTKEEAKDRIEKLKQSASVNVEFIISAKNNYVTPLILALCGANEPTTLEREVEKARDKIAWIDEAIAYYKTILQEDETSC